MLIFSLILNHLFIFTKKVLFEFVQVVAEVQIAVPFRACEPLTNSPRMNGRIAIVQRQDCMFQEKARHVQESGAVGIIIIGNLLENLCYWMFSDGLFSGS